MFAATADYEKGEKNGEKTSKWEKIGDLATFATITGDYRATIERLWIASDYRLWQL